MQPFLPYGRQDIGEEEIAAVSDALRAALLTTGPQVEAFEQDLAQAVAAPEAVVCNSGTAALHLICLALGLAPGDVVIVPSITFVATANAAALCGATIVFSDVDPVTALMRPQDLSDAIGRARSFGPVKLIMPVCYGGRSPDRRALHALLPDGVRIVYDSCHALGSTVDEGVPVGSCQFADAEIFSFHPVKTVTMGEGGAITLRDPELARILRRMRSHDIIRNPSEMVGADRGQPWYYEMHAPGYNYRVPDILCALGRVQLARLPEFAAARQALAARYLDLFSGHRIVHVVGDMPGQTHVLHLLTAHIDFAAAGLDRAGLMRALSQQGIGTQVHYVPVHGQPYYRRQAAHAELPGADAFYASCLSLPLFPAMTSRDVDRVHAAMERCLTATSGPQSD